jgi:hypothetical protein
MKQALDIEIKRLDGFINIYFTLLLELFWE